MWPFKKTNNDRILNIHREHNGTYLVSHTSNITKFPYRIAIYKNIENLQRDLKRFLGTAIKKDVVKQIKTQKEYTVSLQDLENVTQ